MLKKEITLKSRSMILIILSTIILTGFSMKMYEENRNEIYIKNEIESAIGYKFRLDFMTNAQKLKYGLSGESYNADAMNAIELQVFIDAIGREDPIYRADKRICKFMEENNLTQMLQDSFTTALKDRKEKNLLKEDFYKGIKRANKMCSSLSDNI